MKRLFLLFVLVLICFSVFAYNVSFLSYSGNKAIAKISYSIEKDGKTQIVDLSKSYSISSDDKIYISFTKADNISIKSVILRCWIGGSDLKRDLELQSSEDGKLFFYLGDLGPATEWSVEPVLERIPIELKFEALCNGERIGGKWYVNSDKINGNSTSISSLTDFSVSYELEDRETYYFVSSSPKQLAYSDGKVVFSIQKPSEDSEIEDSYTVNLEKYSTISFKENKDKITKLLYNGAECDLNSAEDIKLKKGETFSVYTKGDYAVKKGSGLQELSQTKIEDINNWKTELQVLKDSTIYNYSIDICPMDYVKFSVEIPNFEKLDNEDRFKISGSTNLAKTKDDSSITYQVDVMKDGSLGIFIPKPNNNVKYSIKFQTSDGSLSERNKDDITSNYNENFSYSEITTLEKIIVKREEGFRPYNIETQKKKAEESNIVLRYYVGGSQLTDGVFLPIGTTISAKVIGLIPEEKEIKINGRTLSGELTQITKISECSSSSDFELEIVDIPGAYFDFDSLSYENGTVVFTRNGNTLHGKTYIKVNDIIHWEAIASDGYMISGTSNDDIRIDTEDSIKQKFENLHVSFVLESELVQRKITLKKAKWGDVEYFYDGSKIEASATDDVYAVYECSIADGGEIAFKYKYTKMTSGFNIREDKEKELNGWTYTYEKDGEDKEYIKVKRTLKEGDIECTITPIELKESDEYKPELIIKVDSSVLEVAKKDFTLYYKNNGETNYVYKNGIDNRPKDDDKNENTTENIKPYKISSTDTLSLFFPTYELEDGKALIVECKFTYNDGTESQSWLYGTGKEKGSTTVQIPKYECDEEGNYKYAEAGNFLSKKYQSTNVKKIEINFKISDASYFEDRKIDNAIVEVYGFDNDNYIKLDSENILRPSDKVFFEVIPNSGYYLKVNGKNQDGKYKSEKISYKDLNTKLANVEVKKYISITLQNINPSGDSCKYTKEGKPLSDGIHKLKEGESISVTLNNKDYECKKTIFKSGQAWINAFNSIFNKGQINSEIKITSNYDGKTLTLEDFEISKKGE